MLQYLVCASLACLALTANGQGAGTILQNGVSAPADVSLNTFNYYSYSVDQVAYFQPLKISVKCSQGTIGVYAGFGNLPNATLYSWSSTVPNMGHDWVISIQPVEKDFQVGVLFIGCGSHSFRANTPFGEISFFVLITFACRPTC